MDLLVFRRDAPDFYSPRVPLEPPARYALGALSAVMQ